MRFELEGGAGECRVEQDGLYWRIDAACCMQGADAPRLYCDGRALGPFLPDGGRWRLRTRVSNRAFPITGRSRFTLSVERVLPYDPASPLPEPLFRLIPAVQNGTLFLRIPQEAPNSRP